MARRSRCMLLSMMALALWLGACSQAFNIFQAAPQRPDPKMLAQAAALSAILLSPSAAFADDIATMSAQERAAADAVGIDKSGTLGPLKDFLKSQAPNVNRINPMADAWRDWGRAQGEIPKSAEDKATYDTMYTAMGVVGVLGLGVGFIADSMPKENIDFDKIRREKGVDPKYEEARVAGLKAAIEEAEEIAKLERGEIEVFQ